jgi:hypothetical protein
MTEDSEVGLSSSVPLLPFHLRSLHPGFPKASLLAGPRSLGLCCLFYLGCPFSLVSLKNSTSKIFTGVSFFCGIVLISFPLS